MRKLEPTIILNKHVLELAERDKRIEELEVSLKSSNGIRKAEKKILIQEVEKNKGLVERNEELEAELKSAKSQIDVDFQCLRLGGQERREAEQRAEKAESSLRKLDIILQSLTPGGSEFVNDPDRCVAYIKDVRETQHNMIKKLTMKNRKLKEAVEEHKKLVGTHNSLVDDALYRVADEIGGDAK